jgi:3',5'-cyclic AMP phosphodiesterase CpdA
VKLSVLLLFSAAIAITADPFIELPYLQLGSQPTDPTRMSLLWHSPDTPATFSVRAKPVGSREWTPQTNVTSRRIAVRTIEPHLVYQADLQGLKPGTEFDYEVSRDGEVVFTSRGLARKSPKQSYKFAVFGDCGQNNAPQRQIAAQVHKLLPDFIQIPGDIVYSRGRISEYREKFYPIYNSDQLPLLRSRPMIGVPGNHDTATAELTKYPDAQAYYYYWSQPLNGPVVEPRKFEADPADIEALLTSAGPGIKQMGSFSFDYGNSHWIALDMNSYLDWTSPQLRDWLERDLKAAQRSTWRFVTMHQPPFNSSRAHFREQHPRWLADLFEKYRVDVVLAGHVHNYQRTYPLKFKMADGQPNRGMVEGQFDLDKQFDGVKKTRAKAPIYLVTGAGGAGLYDTDQEDAQASWQRYTLKFISKVNSFSWFEIEGKKLLFRQIDGAGRELDRFTLTK